MLLVPRHRYRGRLGLARLPLPRHRHPCRLSCASARHVAMYRRLEVRVPARAPLGAGQSVASSRQSDPPCGTPRTQIATLASKLHRCHVTPLHRCAAALARQEVQVGEGAVHRGRVDVVRMGSLLLGGESPEVPSSVGHGKLRHPWSLRFVGVVGYAAKPRQSSWRLIPALSCTRCQSEVGAAVVESILVLVVDLVIVDEVAAQDPLHDYPVQIHATREAVPLSS